MRKSGDFIIAIDAGHGGNDPGCLGNRLVEKDVALDVARSLAAAIEAKPRMRAVLTRSKDYFVPLGRRQVIAKQFDADIFVSIHCNSAESATARGVEGFGVSLQGAADKGPPRTRRSRERRRPRGGRSARGDQKPLLDILYNLKLNESMRRSERLGEPCCPARAASRRRRRVAQTGPLAVLKSISCPSVLVELGFVPQGTTRACWATAVDATALCRAPGHGRERTCAPRVTQPARRAPAALFDPTARRTKPPIARAAAVNSARRSRLAARAPTRTIS